MKSLNDVINNMPVEAKIPALRAIVHSTMTRAIGSIRQDIRDRSRTSRNEESVQSSLDDRNQQDEDSRIDESVLGREPDGSYSIGNEVSRIMGFEETEKPIIVANKLHRVYAFADSELRTIAQTRWDHPLSFDAMLEFMITKAQPLGEELCLALAAAAKCKPEDIRKMHELQDRQEREELKKIAPEITLTFNGFEDGNEDAVDNLSPYAQYQLGTKVRDSLEKAKNSILARVIKTRRIADLGAIPIIDAEYDATVKWLEEFEGEHADEFQEMIDAGRFYA